MVGLLPVVPRRNRAIPDQVRDTGMGGSVCGMRRDLAEAAARFKLWPRGLTRVEQKANIGAVQRHAPALIRNERVRKRFGAQTGKVRPMLAPFAALAFLAALWLLVMIAAQMLDESGAKILAALSGHSLLATAPAIRPVAGR